MTATAMVSGLAVTAAVPDMAAIAAMPDLAVIAAVPDMTVAAADNVIAAPFLALRNDCFLPSLLLPFPFPIPAFVSLVP